MDHVSKYLFCSQSQSISPGTTGTTCPLIWESSLSVKACHSQCILMILKKSDVHLNEHGQIVFTSMQASCYQIGLFQMDFNLDVSQHVQFQHPWIDDLPLSQIKRWSSSLTSQKDNLCSAYDAIKHIHILSALQVLSDRKSILCTR